jgi:hypothetical protein
MSLVFGIEDKLVLQAEGAEIDKQVPDKIVPKRVQPPGSCIELEDFRIVFCQQID